MVDLNHLLTVIMAESEMAILAISVPISKDDYGAFRVANTRVTLDVIVAAHLHGDTPEQIHTGFPTLRLADIYAVITYYLNNQEEVDAYLSQRDAEAEQLHHDLEAKRPDMFQLQRRLQKRAASQD